MQLQLFHPLSYDGIPILGETIIMEDRRTNAMTHIYNWRCLRCGQRGMATIYKRQDLLEWAKENHQCKKVEGDYV